MMMIMMMMLPSCWWLCGCDIGGCTCNNDIRYLMFNTITAAAATAMMIMVVLVVKMVAGTDNDYA